MDMHIKSHMKYALAFLLPILIFSFVLKINAIVPFGNNALSIWDAKIQYLDWLCYFKDVFAGQQSLFYSFGKMLGGNCLALFHSYFSSPLNFLIVFFKKEHLPLFFTLVITLKLALASLNFFIFIKQVFKGLKVWACLALSLSYAFSSYSIQQASNIMWLDGVYMLPMILLGIYKLLFADKKLFLICSIALNILFNWYSAYFNCLFAIFYSVYLLWDKHAELTNTIFNTVRNLLFSFALGTGLSMFIFLPTIILLRQGEGSFERHIFYPKFTGNILTIFENYIIGGFSERGSVSLYCGVLIFVLIVYYFVSQDIPGLTKKKTAAFLFFLSMCFYFFPLFGIFGGFKDATSYYYRYGYVAIAFLVTVAAAGLNSIWLDCLYRDNRLALSLVLFGILALAFNFVHPKYGVSYVYLNIVFGLIYYLVLQRLDIKKMPLLLVVLVMVEIIINSTAVIKHCGTMDVDKYKNYVNNEQVLISSIKNYDPAFYRIASNLNRNQYSSYNTTANYNEPLAYGYNGICHYSSTYDKRQYDFLNKAGYNYPNYPDKFRFLITNTQLLSIESLLGVKYILSDVDYKFLQQLSLDKANNKTVFRNQYAFPIAFKTSKDFYPLQYTGNPFEYQNALFAQLFGVKDLFTKVAFVQQKTDTGLCWKIDALDVNRLFYGYVDTKDKKKTTLGQLGYPEYKYSRWTAPRVVMFDSSQPVTGIYMPKVGLDDVSDVAFYQLDLHKLQECQKIAVAGIQKDICIRNDGYISCQVQAKAGEKLFLSVPFDEGWAITNNGIPIQPALFEDTLMVIPLSPGSNALVLQYKTRGIFLGLAFSIVSLILTWLFVRMKANKV